MNEFMMVEDEEDFVDEMGWDGGLKKKKMCCRGRF
jgi:hypothetical protein